MGTDARMDGVNEKEFRSILFCIIAIPNTPNEKIMKELRHFSIILLEYVFISVILEFLIGYLWSVFEALPPSNPYFIFSLTYADGIIVAGIIFYLLTRDYVKSLSKATRCFLYLFMLCVQSTKFYVAHEFIGISFGYILFFGIVSMIVYVIQVIEFEKE